MQNRYVVAIRNRNDNAVWQQDDFDHSTTFLIGRISGVAETDERTADDRMRYVIEFDAYAEIEVPNAWGKSRNPVWFTNLDELGIDLNDVEFVSVEDGATVKPATRPSIDGSAGISFAEARRGLAARYGVSPSSVEIVLRG